MRAAMAVPAPTSPLRRNLAILALVLAIAVFVGVALFGIDGPVQWGHYGYHIGEYTLRARNTLRFHTLIPAQWTGPGVPPTSSYYLHHPILAHQFLTAAFFLFGERLWIVRAIPALWGLTTLLALFTLVRRHWGHAPAALAAICFATLPFTAAFSIHYDPGHLAMPGLVVALDAWLRYREESRFRWAVLAVAGFAIGGMSEWTPYLATAWFVPIAFLLGWGAVEKMRPTMLLLKPSQRLVFFMGLTMVATIGFHFWFTRRAGVLEDLTGSYGERRSSPGWRNTMHTQWQWFSMYFGKPYAVVLIAWAATTLARALALRSRARDLIPFTFIAAWATYVAIFQRGLNIHSYRIMPLAVFMPLALASVTTDLRAALAWTIDRLPFLWRSRSFIAAVSTLVLLGSLFGFAIPHAHATLLSARATAGTAEFQGYSPHLEELLFARTLRDRIPRDAVVFTHDDLGVRLEFLGLIDRELRTITSFASLPHRIEGNRPGFVIWDHVSLGASDRTAETKLVREHGVTLMGPFALCDLSKTEPVAETWLIERGIATKRWRYFSSWAYPPLRLTPGIRTEDAYWLAVRGVGLTFRPEIPAPPRTDLPGMVNYLDYLQARGDRSEQAADILRNLQSQLSPGPDVGSIDVIAWGISRGSSALRLVMTATTSNLGELDLRIVYETQRAGPVVVAPTPEIVDQRTEIWRDGFPVLWNASLPDLALCPCVVKLELYERGNAPSPSGIKKPTTPPAPATSKKPDKEPAPVPKPPKPPVPLASGVLGSIAPPPQPVKR